MFEYYIHRKVVSGIIFVTIVTICVILATVRVKLLKDKKQKAIEKYNPFFTFYAPAIFNFKKYANELFYEYLIIFNQTSIVLLNEKNNEEYIIEKESINSFEFLDLRQMKDTGDFAFKNFDDNDKLLSISYYTKKDNRTLLIIFKPKPYDKDVKDIISFEQDRKNRIKKYLNENNTKKERFNVLF